MLQVLIDAAILMFLLKTVNDEDVDFLTAAIVAVATSIGTAILASVLFGVMGLAGVLLAVVIGAIALGAAVSALFGAEIKRSLLIGTLFVVIHIGVRIGMYAAFGT